MQVLLGAAFLFLVQFGSGQESTASAARRLFADALVSKYGSSSGYLTYDGLLQMVDKVEKTSQGSPSTETVAVSCEQVGYDKCLLSKCLSIMDILKVSSIADTAQMNRTALERILPALVYKLQSGACWDHNSGNSSSVRHLKRRPTQAEAWGYGIGFVTLINVISMVGGLLVPFLEKSFFKKLLAFLVAMATGCLFGTGMLILLPEALQLESNSTISSEYIPKLVVVSVGIFCFYIFDAVLSAVLKKKKKVNVKEHNGEEAFSLASKDKERGHSHGSVNGRRNLMYMVLTGDALHNFVDGLSIGVAFTTNLMTGISISLAVVCEELPHELGDIAILLHSGLSMKRALLYNFFAALVCYAGLIIGIVLGEATNISTWIFAFAGGIFLYVSLVVLISEMKEKKAESDESGRCLYQIMALEDTGIFVGYVIIVLLALYQNNINVV